MGAHGAACAPQHALCRLREKLKKLKNLMPKTVSLAQLGFGESQMLDKLLYDEEVRRCVLTFEQQFHYGVFYAYMKLREQVGWRGRLCARGCAVRIGGVRLLQLPAWRLAAARYPPPPPLAGNPEHNVDLGVRGAGGCTGGWLNVMQRRHALQLCTPVGQVPVHANNARCVARAPACAQDQKARISDGIVFTF